MSINEKQAKNTPPSFWLRSRFFVLTITVTFIILLFIIWMNKASYLKENIIPAGISLLNTIIAYVISKKEQGDRTYKEMMKNIYIWTLSRFIGMALIIIVLILSKSVEALPFIFTFIGFYILHQTIQISMMKWELK